MKMQGVAAAVVCIAVIGAVWAAWPEPVGDQVWAYQKLQPADYRLLHSDALGFVTVKADEGFELHTRFSGATSFEIRCKDVVVLDVENAPSRVLIRMPTDALRRAPDIAHLHANFRRLLGQAPNRARLLLASDEPSWLGARLQCALGRVSRKQPCGLDATVDPHRS
ncbi:cold-shock protein [Stenotrophomonas maltophilia]